MKKRNQLRTHRRHRRYRAARAERLRRAAMQQEGLSVPNAADDAARYERIKSKFYFQQVLPDQSNVNAASLKGRTSNDTASAIRTDGERPSSLKKKEDKQKDKKIQEAATSDEAGAPSDADPEDATAMEESLNQSASSIVNKTPQHHHPSLCEVISSWASVASVPPPPSDVCCICLEGYSCGETICVAKKPSCDHLFHKDCVLEWMKTNDDCPLCRVNLLY